MRTSWLLKKAARGIRVLLGVGVFPMDPSEFLSRSVLYF